MSIISLRTKISWLALTFVAVFYGFLRTTADAGHAVCAVVSPNGLSVNHTDVVANAKRHALAATDTGIGYIKVLCFHAQCIKQGIDHMGF